MSKSIVIVIRKDEIRVDYPKIQAGRESNLISTIRESGPIGEVLSKETIETIKATFPWWRKPTKVEVKAEKRRNSKGNGSKSR